VLGKGRLHRELLARHARRGVFVAAVNQVGGNDELVFDGHAVVMAPGGRVLAAGPGFREHLLVCDLAHPDPAAGSGAGGAADDPLLAATDERLLWDALVLGLRDYCRKSGFRSAVLGLSGGIDSALVAVLSAAALGPAGVLGVSMPGPFSSPGSRDDAADSARRLGIGFTTIPIEAAHSLLLGALAPAFAGRAPDTAEENLQSRLRGTVLMALSNKLGHILLSTGNKSELAVGYCTLYGDMNGGLSVISDLTKLQVYALSRWINAHWRELGIAGLAGPPIPDASIFKPPSAELRPNQTDQDSLPPYDQLDAIIDAFVNRRLPAAEIARELPHVEPQTIARVLRLITVNEYKRCQAAPGLKVTGVAFGSGRRMPLAQGWRPEVSLGEH
jgi:NAD+ synthase/NAD+ synthase (glutamine-hydrolysing)